MARVELASTAEGFILANKGGALIPAVGATAYIYTHGTTEEVAVYGGEMGGATLAQPLITDMDGIIPGWIESGQTVDIRASQNGVTEPTRTIEAISAGTVVSSGAIQWAALPDLLVAGAITRDANGAATAAPVVWPDGDTGVYKATEVSSVFPGAVDAFTITKARGEVTHTYTQAKVTRDSTGAVTNRPIVTVI